MGHHLARLMAALGTALGVSAAHAQFEGIFVGAGMGFYKATVYGRSFSQLNLAGEVPDANEIGKIDVSAVSVSAKLQNAWSISVLPGYKFGNAALFFGRIGHVRAELTGSFLNPDASQTHTGWLWGLGAEGAFSRNLALTVDYQFYDLKRENYPVNGPLQPACTGTVVGVQYTL